MIKSEIQSPSPLSFLFLRRMLWSGINATRSSMICICKNEGKDRRLENEKESQGVRWMKSTFVMSG